MSWLWSYGGWIYNKFVSDLQQVGGFLRVLSFTNKTNLHDITEILLQVALNTINLTNLTQTTCMSW